MIDHPKPTLYTTLSLHHSRYEYKRGYYLGDAPAIADKRWKSHFRVQKLRDCMAVMFHNTRIIRAYPDGTVMLDSAGWSDSPTTRAAFASHGLVFADGAVPVAHVFRPCGAVLRWHDAGAGRAAHITDQAPHAPGGRPRRS